MRRLAWLLLLAGCGTTEPVLDSIVRFESAHARPLALSPSGKLLAAVNTEDARVELFTVSERGKLKRDGAILVGLEPVSVAFRTDSELWVVNAISDSINVIDLDRRLVTATLQTGDEPADLLFAAGHAWLAVRQLDRVERFAPDGTMTPIPLDGRMPHRLASDGTSVWAIAQRGGNGTATVGVDALFPGSAPRDARRLAALGLPPEVDCAGRSDDEARLGRIVSGDAWAACLPGERAVENDLFRIDTSSLEVRAHDGLGSTLRAIALDPAGKAWVAADRAHNLRRFERAETLRGKFLDQELVAPDGERLPLERLSQLSSLLFDERGRWLSALGSASVVEVDSGRSIEVGDGPSGMVRHPASGRLFVMLRIAHAVVAVDPERGRVVQRLALFDPLGGALAEGRRLFYGATDNSAHGDLACASCHVDGGTDGLAWELGDPAAPFVPYPADLRFVEPSLEGPVDCPPEDCADHAGFTGRKGPMLTTPMRGLGEPLHWRGDRPTLFDFDATYVDLLGRSEAPSREAMAELRSFLLGISFPPNPYRPLDDRLPDRPLPVAGERFAGNPAVGELVFESAVAFGGVRCSDCHAGPTGSPNAMTAGTLNGSPHGDLEIAQLRGLYERVGPPGKSPPSFGLSHDGSAGGLARYLSAERFSLTPQQVRDLSAFLTRFPGDVPAAVGAQRTVEAPSADVELLLGLDGCDVIVSTMLDGEVRVALHESGRWFDGALSTDELFERAEAPLTFTCAPVGEGARLAR